MKAINQQGINDEGNEYGTTPPTYTPYITCILLIALMHTPSFHYNLSKNRKRNKLINNNSKLNSFPIMVMGKNGEGNTSKKTN